MPRKIITGKRALEVIEEFCLNYAEACHNLIRDPRDVPHPELSIGHMLAELLAMDDDKEVRTAQGAELYDLLNGYDPEEAMRHFREAWYRDYKSRGLLSTEPEQTTTAHPNLSANCFVAVLESIIVAYSEAIRQLRDEVYPQRQRKRLGPVYTRNYTGRNGQRGKGTRR